MRPHRVSVWPALVCVLVWAHAASAQLRVLVDRAAAVPGRVLVLPVAFDGGADPRAPVWASLADGRVLEASVYRLVAQPAVGPASPIEVWMGRSKRWSAVPVDRLSRGLDGEGRWVVVVRTGDDAAGSPLRIGDELVPIQWLDGAATLRGDGQDWRIALDSPGELARLAATQRSDPMLGWRAGLLDDHEPTAMDDAIVEALALQQELLWRVGLDRLWAHDEALAGRLVRTLWATVRFERLTRVPAWTSDPDALASLLATLINPALDERVRSRRIGAWIADQPAQVAWVIDDAGTPGVVRLGAASLTDQPVLAWAQPAGSPAPAEPAEVPPHEAIVLEAASPATIGATGLWDVHLGSELTRQRIVAGRVGLVPPGLTIGPLLDDWTLDDWTRGLVAGAPDRDRLAMARLLLIADDPPEPADASRGIVVYRRDQHRGHLALYLECLWPEPGRDLVRIWIGPTGAPRAVLRVERSGMLTDELTRRAPMPITVVEQGDRWSALVPLPAGVLAADGSLRLGIERLDPAGGRAAWPRRMLPWQRAPGRVLIDPSSWDGLPGG